MTEVLNRSTPAVDFEIADPHAARAPSPRRVCSVAYTHYRSDPRVQREAEALRWHGDDVTVLALQETGHPVEDLVEGVRVIGIPVEHHRGNGLAPYLASYGRFFVRAAAHLPGGHVRMT